MGSCKIPILSSIIKRSPLVLIFISCYAHTILASCHLCYQSPARYTFHLAVSGFPKKFENTNEVAEGKFGEDAWFYANWKHIEVIGIADGVGGWKQIGIDPSQFATVLMENCKKIVTSGKFKAKDPTNLLVSSYEELSKTEPKIYGGSTACILIFDKSNRMLHSANLGDSGFLLIRRGKIVQKSKPQFHMFNTPFQLTVPVDGQPSNGDSPTLASKKTHKFQAKDVVLLATDGLFDNIYEKELVELLSKLDGGQEEIQRVANEIANIALKRSMDKTFLSPFAKYAQNSGKHYIIGGKRDDITVLIATINH